MWADGIIYLTVHYSTNTNMISIPGAVFNLIIQQYIS